MNWSNIIVLGLLFYWIYQVEKRFGRIGRGRGYGKSKWIIIEAINAVISNPKFKELAGIDSPNNKNFTKRDQEKWDKFILPKMGRTYVKIDYLASEDAYFVKCVGFPNYFNIVHRVGRNNLLYSAIILGDENGYKPHLEFLIYERFVKNSKGKLVWMLVPCLKYKENSFNPKGSEFQILCEFPMFGDKSFEKEAISNGFKVNTINGNYYKDSFGEWETRPDILTYSKNGVDIEETL